VLLFKIDGATVYRFADAGEYHYFLLGDGSAINTRQSRTRAKNTAEHWDDSAVTK
jgi:hypothetical protein